MQVPITFIYFSNQYINQSLDRWDPINYRVPDKCGMLTVCQERRFPWGAAWSALCARGKSTKYHIKSQLTWILLSAVFNTSGKTHPRPHPNNFCGLRVSSPVVPTSYVLFCKILDTRSVQNQGWDTEVTDFHCVLCSDRKPGHNTTFRHFWLWGTPPGLHWNVTWGCKIEQRSTNLLGTSHSVWVTPFYSELSHMKKCEG